MTWLLDAGSGFIRQPLTWQRQKRAREAYWRRTSRPGSTAWLTIPCAQMNNRSWLVDEAGLRTVAKSIATQLQRGDLVFLSGDLGTGKTTFAQAAIRTMGFKGVVNSPTFTLVEVYQTDYGELVHLDLYRLESLTELENIGIRDYLDSQSICLIEWPQKGSGLLPAADMVVDLEYAGDRRRLGVTVRAGRGLDLEIIQ